jgi:hypothetical protein
VPDQSIGLRGLFEKAEYDLLVKFNPLLHLPFHHVSGKFNSLISEVADEPGKILTLVKDPIWEAAQYCTYQPVHAQDGWYENIYYLLTDLKRAVIIAE